MDRDLNSERVCSQTPDQCCRHFQVSVSRPEQLHHSQSLDYPQEETKFRETFKWLQWDSHCHEGKSKAIEGEGRENRGYEKAVTPFMRSLDFMSLVFRKTLRVSYTLDVLHRIEITIRI